MTQNIAQQTPQTPEQIMQNKLQKLSVKFNAAMTLNQEIGEAVSDYINASK